MKYIVEGTNVMDLDQKSLIEFRRHKMSMVFQRFGLFPHKTVIENVGYGLEVQGKTPEERNKIAMEKIEAVGLNGLNTNIQINYQEECNKELVLQELCYKYKCNVNG